VDERESTTDSQHRSGELFKCIAIEKFISTLVIRHYTIIIVYLNNKVYSIWVYLTFKAKYKVGISENLLDFSTKYIQCQWQS
jgi:hypothetical protein